MPHDIDLIAPGSNYLFTHTKSENERTRLNDQHRWIKRCVCDNRLIYDRTLQIKDGSNVLDAATGTGIWLTDLANQIPADVELYGIDLATQFFPEDHPKNMHFVQGSITALPKDFTAKFDVINQRLLRAALQAPEWLTVVSEIYRALKPGGYVQFYENAANRPTPGPASATYAELLEALWQGKGLLYDCSEQLPEMLREAGFVDIRTEQSWAPVTAKDGPDGEEGKRSQSSAWQNWKDTTMKLGGLGFVDSEEEYDKLVDDFLLEYEESGARLPMNIVYARKPAQA